MAVLWGPRTHIKINRYATLPQILLPCVGGGLGAGERGTFTSTDHRTEMARGEGTMGEGTRGEGTRGEGPWGGGTRWQAPRGAATDTGRAPYRSIL